MRLIDADLLKKNCKCTGTFEDNFKGVDLINLAKVIDAQPTAYDLDEVIMRLKCDECEKCNFFEICAGSRYCEKCHEKIIKIVKAGGVNDQI